MSVLLLPTVRNPRARFTSPTLPNKSPKPKHPSRSRLASPHPDPHSAASVGHAWLGNNALFEIVQDHLVLKGYQLFVVEKWSVFSTYPHRSPILPQGYSEDEIYHYFSRLYRRFSSQGQSPPSPLSLELALPVPSRFR